MSATLGELKATGVAKRLNLCDTDPRFTDFVNRVTRWLLLYGGWWGTVKRAHICVYDRCFTTPGCVANVESVFTCCRGGEVKSRWYEFLESWSPTQWCGSQVAFVPFDTIPTISTLCGPKVLRTYLSDPSDRGKTITYMGYDKNNIWIRSRVNGMWQEGEVVTLASPFVDTVNTFGAVTNVTKSRTNGPVRTFGHAEGSETLTEVGVYEHWETSPMYRRYKVHNYPSTRRPECGPPIVEAMVKLEFIPVVRDSDPLLIANIPALELGMEALKAKDDGDLAKCDVLLYGDARNRRLGAIPLLKQELRTYTGDTFIGGVKVHGTSNLRRVFAGFQ